MQTAHAQAESDLLAGETALGEARAVQEDVFARLQERPRGGAGVP